MNEDRPVIINPSPLAEQAASLTRDILVWIAVLPGLLAILGTRDVVKIIIWLQSTEGATALGLVVLGAMTLWRQIVTRRAKAKLVTVAQAAPDSVAVIKGEELPVDAAGLAQALKDDPE